MFISAKKLKIKYFLSAREWLNNFIRVPRKQISHGNLREVYSQKGYFKSIISMKAVIDFIFLGSKITADHDCRYEIKRHLLLGRKSMTNLDSVLKRRDITLPEYSLEGLLLKLKLLYLGHLMQNADSLEKTLMLWKTEGKRRRRRQKMRWLDSIPNSMDVNLSELLEIVEDRGTGMLQSMKLQWVRHNLSTEKWQGKIYFNNLVWIGRRQWQPTPVLLPGKSHGQRSLVGSSPWGR